MNILEICLACIVIVVFATCPNTASESKRRDVKKNFFNNLIYVYIHLFLDYFISFLFQAVSY